MIKGLVYISKTIHEFNFEELHELSEKAANYNKQYGITGYLYYEKKYFLQYIEGKNKDIDRLIENIENDDRHEVLSIQVIKDISERKFPAWHMHQLTKSSLMQINMENVLIDYLSYCSKNEGRDINTESIWRMIDKLSKFRKRLSYSLNS
ncbi:BLUF domain-containing protein [Aquimarina sp. 2201CG1-2-11]|uniref:BLUF domain-containing protein n=1 Tax=Aquimarina discodermiae TaxID=3231043 RepID=UPI003461BCC9